MTNFIKELIKSVAAKSPENAKTLKESIKIFGEDVIRQYHPMWKTIDKMNIAEDLDIVQKQFELTQKLCKAVGDAAMSGNKKQMKLAMAALEKSRIKHELF